MSASNVVPLFKNRRRQVSCGCRPEVVCYPHRLSALADRVEAARARVEPLRFADWSTFDGLSCDVLDVLTQITDECLPDERTAR